MAAQESLDTSSVLRRPSTTVLPIDTLPSFLITAKDRSYRFQYASIYFIRLGLLRQFVEKNAVKLWKGLNGNPVAVPRVLEVTKGQLCYIIGTVYMDMPLKPNVLDDIGRDFSLPAPPQPPCYYSDDDNIMLEDESGRIKLVGERLKDARLVTGVVMGALGMETPVGDFEVADFCFADMAPQVSQDDIPCDDMDVDPDGLNPRDEWIAVVSGLDIGSPTIDDAKTQMMVEYLTGEAGEVEGQSSSTQISRLIVAGNSLIPSMEHGDAVHEHRPRRPEQEITPVSPHPILGLTALLNDVSQTMPVHVLPGKNDPAGILLPQQPFPRTMFGQVSKLNSFHCETNPTYLHIRCDEEAPAERTILINSGQPLDDIFKYLPTPPTTRLDVLEATLRWRHMAPTAPDTLWCHPYYTKDPFLLTSTPDLYIVGCQKMFGTRLIKQNQQRCRIVMVPNFSNTGILVLVNVRTLDVRTIRFGTDSGDDIEDDVGLPADPLSSTNATTESVSAPSSTQDMEA
ncbi:DNA polymerase alpha/epsilon subunit B domain containing protein [Amanita muscaria]